MKKFVELLIVLLLNVSCVTMNSNFCPYEVVDDFILFEKKENIYDYAGAYFEIFNDSQKEISSVVISFELTSEGTDFSETIQITEKVPVVIFSQEKETVTINLDTYLTDIDTDEIKVEQIFIKRIEYQDGSTWNDVMGRYGIFKE